ncbi:hypothetical protein ECG_03747 [Echinococcus granulosus]|uniref:Uncharacterized protein n=1 Tax=Echinococcus granulosus TaxID=6210 RepID=A0A068WJX4_ECHGR|nr:hypothetical protein ECG_03747 [Echinococcus granulosus]CDS17992.1 hypothetical protein EgrG_001078700 [Echinococcus granulosus]
MAIEEKANIDTLLIAAEVLERDLVKGVHFQSKEHLFPRDSLIQSAQRRFSTTCSPPIASNLNFHSASGSPSASPLTPSRRHWLTSDLIISRTAVPNRCLIPSSNISLTDLTSVLSISCPRSSNNSNNGSNSGRGSLVPPPNSESPATWQVEAANSPTRTPVSCTSSTVATQTITSSFFSSMTSDTVNTLPLRQLRTALLSERLVSGGKTQRAFSDVNPPWPQLDFVARSADLAGLISESVVASPEKTTPRLPAKKRKFDWGERSNGDSSPVAPPPPAPQLPPLPSQSQPASLIVDKPAQLSVESTRCSSVSSFADSSATTAASLFHCSATQRGVPRLETQVKQRKLSYPGLSFTSDTAGGLASLCPPPPIPAFSARVDVPARRSSLVVDVRNSSNSSSTSIPTSASSSSPSSITAATSNSTSRMRSPPIPPQSSSRWKCKFPSPPAPNVSTTVPPPQRYPTHHSEAGRRYSVFGAPAGPTPARRHSSVLSSIFPTISPSTVTSFNAPTPLHYQRQQQQPNQQPPPFYELKPFSRPSIHAKSMQTEEGTGSYGPTTVGTGTRPLSAPEEPVHPTRSSPLKVEWPSPQSAASPLLPPPTEIPTTASKERQRRVSHVPVLGAILSSSSSAANPETAYNRSPIYNLGDRKHSFDSLLPITKPRNHGGAVLLTGDVCCPPTEKSFDGGFPLLLVSAPTSASAAEFAAATAVASGKPASSLIPLPVQIVPGAAAGSTASTSSTAGGDTGVTLVSKITTEADQRLVFPLVLAPAPDGQMSGCTLGFPLLVSSRPRHCPSPTS